MQTYTGSCHCGAVTFTVEADLTEGLRCNCSHCKRKGFILAFVPPSQFTSHTGSDNLTTYHFNKKHIDHTFCKTCGVQAYAYGHDGKGNHMYAINLNCIENLDTETLTIKEYDGKSV